MFKFTGNALHITRTEAGVINITKKSGFNIGDTIELQVYEADGLDSEPVLEKSVKIENASNVASLELYSADTDLGEPANDIVEYWFQIRMNGDTTILGFDQNKAKILYLYPCGVNK